MTQNPNKFIYWTPRVLSIIFILFLALFSLDVIETEQNAKDIAIGLLMHNISAFILAIVLAIAWRREIIGGIVFILAGIAYILFILLSGRFEVDMWLAFFIIAVPAFLIGGLFIVGWVKKRKDLNSTLS